MKERFVRAALRLLEAVPLGILSAFLEGILLALWAVDGRHRRIARINLRIAFPAMGDKEASRIVRRSYANLAISLAEFLHLPRMDREYVRRHVRIEGAERVRRAIEERGTGPIALTGHVGNWELLAHVAATNLAPIAFVVRPLKDPVFDDLVTARRESAGNRVIRKEEAARELMREARGGRLVGILADQNTDRRRGIPVDFFTMKAYTTVGPARLALALDTDILPAFLHRDPRRKFHHVLRVGPPLRIDRDAPREEEVVRVTRRCNEAIEAAIREDPSQWLWMHKRWKTRPPGEPDPYEGP